MKASVLSVFMLTIIVPELTYSEDINGSIHDIFFSKNWKDLYNLYKEQCDTDHKNKVMTWSTVCVNLCDEKGNPLFLDRRNNPYDVGLGSVALKYGHNGTRPQNDSNLYLGDPCPPDKNPKSLVSFKFDDDRKDRCAIICNEASKIEYLSLRFSRCYNSQENKPVPDTPSNKVIGADCVIKYNNATITDITHGNFWKSAFPDDRYCLFHYCCDGIHHTFSGDCSISDFCKREID